MPAPHTHKITERDVIYVLQCPDSDRTVAQRLGVSRQAVANIRNGRAYRKIAPQLPRRDDRPIYKKDGETCVLCNYWNNDGCAFRFPEAAHDLRFAQECSMYALQKETLSSLAKLIEQDDDE